jgi:hypothetical protein
MVAYLTSSIFLSILSVMMLGSLYIGRKLIRSSKSISDPILNVIFFFAYYKVLMYYALPAVLNFISDYKYVRIDGIELLDLTYIYLIECISWLPWLAAFFVVSRVVEKKELYSASELIVHKIEQSKLLLNAWVLIYLLNGAYRLIISLDGNDGDLPIYLEIFKGLLMYGGPPASAFLLVLGFRNWGRRSIIIGLSGLAFSILTMSSRGMIIYTLVFLIYVVFVFAPSRKLKLIISFSFLILLSSHFLFGGLPFNSVEIDDSGRVSFSITIHDKKGGRTSWEEIEWRFGALTRYSTGFVTMYDRGEGAGINPIKNSILGFLPRSINPDKPIPSTRDGDDIYSQGMYLINKEIDGYSTMSMTEFSTGGHSYWEMGWFGVLILNFISGLYISMCAYYFQRFGALSIPLMVATFKPWGYVDPKIWVSDIAMQMYQLILPIILISTIAFLFRLLIRSRYKIKHNIYQ